jgi:hypothetical protein
MNVRRAKARNASAEQPRGARRSAVRLDATPRPWEHNPSSWKHRVAVSLVALPALAAAVHMALYQWRVIDSVWDPVFGAQSMAVLDSEASHWIRRWTGIPDAALGAIAYLGDILFALAGSTRRWQFRPWLVILFGLDVIPLGIVSVILVGVQSFVLGQWCFLCISTAVVSLALIALAYDEVWSCLLFLKRVWVRSHSGRALWETMWGRPSAVAYEAGLDIAERRAR